MKVSIITVVFNNNLTIRDAINSILSQTHNDIEFIIVDGGSTDGTLEIINEFKDRISVVISEADMGIYDAMNKGLKIASGEIVGILNSDDIYFNNSIISLVVNEFMNNENLDILYGDLVYVDQNDVANVVRRWVSCDYYSKYFENGNVPPHPSLFLKIHVYNEVGYFNLKYKLASDYEFMLRLFKKHRFTSRHINKYLVKMRLGGATNSSYKNIILGNLEILKSWLDNDMSIPFLLVPKRFLLRFRQYL